MLDALVDNHAHAFQKWIKKKSDDFYDEEWEESTLQQVQEVETSTTGRARQSSLRITG